MLLRNFVLLKTGKFINKLTKMSSSFKDRYIAAGFLEDAEELLNEFITENTTEFKVFASLWRKHHFSLIYMGRPTERELSEFTSEIFRVSMQFLDTEEPFFKNVGGIYLLYGLFRNQILNPPVRIRIIPSEFKNFLRIRHIAAVAPYRSLHYVMDYMIENSFSFVAAPKLLGPMIPRGPGKPKPDDQNVSGVEEIFKSEMTEFLESKILESVSELSKEIEEISETLPVKIDSASHIDYTGVVDRLKAISAPKKSLKGCRSKVSEDIGSRRARIKEAAYKHRSAPHLENTSMELDEKSSNTSEKKKQSRPRQVPKQHRKLGRPKKVTIEEPVEESEEESNIESILDIPPDLVPPECITEKKKREKPKRKLYCN